MSFRYAKREDYNFLYKNDKHVIPDLILDKIKNKEIIIIEEKLTNIGWLRYGYFWDTIPFMNMLWINEKFRGRGIGKQAVLFWESELKDQNFNMVMTSTMSNEGAQHFYRKLGYIDVGSLLLGNQPLEIIFKKNLE